MKTFFIVICNFAHVDHFLVATPGFWAGWVVDGL